MSGKVGLAYIEPKINNYKLQITNWLIAHKYYKYW